MPAPDTEHLDAVADWSRPSIVKSRYNLLTSDYLGPGREGPPAEVKTITHLDPDETPDVAAIRDRMRHEPIVQEFVPKRAEYMFAALYDHGEPLATYQHRQIRGDSYIGGGGVYRKSIFDPRLEDAARRLLAELDWHGLACIEYIEDERSGEFTVVELNPRLWQSLPSTVCAGADFPYYYWLQATGRTDRIDPSYDRDVGCHRLNGEVGYLLSLLNDDSPHVDRTSVVGTLGAIVWSCLTDPNFDYLQLDDPRPFLRGLRQFLGA